ncbi:MAG: hypothetical protein WCI50_03715 [Actinomycetes bacterium]
MSDAVHGVVVVVEQPAAAARLLRSLVARDDLAGTSLSRVRAGTAVTEHRRDRVRHLARIRGFADPTDADPALTTHLVERSLAATAFVVVVVDPDDRAGTRAARSARAVAAGTGRRVEVVDGDATVTAPVAPPVAPLSESERLLTEVVLGSPLETASRWSAWRAEETLEEWPDVARIGDRLLAALGRAGVTGPDVDRLRGVRRRAWYARALLEPAAAALVAALDAAQAGPVLVGDLVAGPAGPGSARWCTRIDLVVDAPFDDARAVVGRLGWVPAGPGNAAGRVAPHRDHLDLRHPDGLGLRLVRHPLPRRAGRRLDHDLDRTHRLVGDADLPVLASAASLVRHWVVSADAPERVSHLIGAVDLIAACRGDDLARARAAAETLGVGATAELQFAALEHLQAPHERRLGP